MCGCKLGSITLKESEVKVVITGFDLMKGGVQHMYCMQVGRRLPPWN